MEPRRRARGRRSHPSRCSPSRRWICPSRSRRKTTTTRWTSRGTSPKKAKTARYDPTARSQGTRRSARAPASSWTELWRKRRRSVQDVVTRFRRLPRRRRLSPARSPRIPPRGSGRPRTSRSSEVSASGRSMPCRRRRRGRGGWTRSTTRTIVAVAVFYKRRVSKTSKTSRTSPSGTRPRMTRTRGGSRTTLRNYWRWTPWTRRWTRRWTMPPPRFPSPRWMASPTRTAPRRRRRERRRRWRRRREREGRVGRLRDGKSLCRSARLGWSARTLCRRPNCWRRRGCTAARVCARTTATARPRARRLSSSPRWLRRRRVTRLRRRGLSRFTTTSSSAVCWARLPRARRGWCARR